ncbi:MAG: hypothetical protein GDA45_04465 [Chromatiales bacterium]|nr:hypothetical protein [Chromatiales bacterium]
MLGITLYNLLKRIPDATDEEIEKAVADVTSTKDLPTKDYLDAVIAKQDARLTWHLVIAIGIYTAIISFMTNMLL